MAVKLSETPEPIRTRKAGSVDEPPTYDGLKLAADVRAAVAKTIGPWSPAATRDSDAERDSLAQMLAVWALEAPERMARLSGKLAYERRAMLADRCRAYVVDSREWTDSLDGRKLIRTRARTSEGKRVSLVLADETTAEQARKWRESERRESRAVPHCSLDSLARETRDGDGAIDWIETESMRERAAADADSVSPLQASGDPVLARAVAIRLDQIKSDREAERAERAAERDEPYMPILWATSTVAAVAIACRIAAGESVAAVARERGCSARTIKRQAASGRAAILADFRSGAVAGAWRECADSLTSAEPDEPGSEPEHFPIRYGPIGTRPLRSLDVGIRPESARRLVDGIDYGPPLVNYPARTDAGALTLGSREATFWLVDEHGRAIPDTEHETSIAGLPAGDRSHVALGRSIPDPEMDGSAFLARDRIARRDCKRDGDGIDWPGIWTDFRPESGSRLAWERSRIARAAEREAVDVAS